MSQRFVLHRTVRTARLIQGQNVTITEVNNGDFLDVTISASGGGGGGGAPTNAKYLTLGTDATLTDERVFTPSARFSYVDNGAGASYALDLNVTGVNAGSYTYASITVDAYGRVTAASSGAAPVAPPSPASTVVTETSFGQSSATGTSSNYAREDHTHGTPAVPAHSSLSSLTWANSGHTGSANAVAAWNVNGVATAVQATDDETMLVRRGGILQWVPLIVGASVIPDQTGVAAVMLANATADLIVGTVV